MGDEDNAERDPRTPVAWQVVERPTPPRVGDTVIVADELSGGELAAKTLPRSLPQPAVTALLDVVEADHQSTRRTDWPQRDLALILTGLLAGLRADELRRADVGDIRRTTASQVRQCQELCPPPPWPRQAT